jgi:hypothetical protein
MPRRMTKAQAKAWKARWEAVNQFEREELRRTRPEVKLRQLAALMLTARALGWEEKLSEGTEEVRERWRRLQKAYDGRS